jgi:beta-phosphoglucomutase
MVHEVPAALKRSYPSRGVLLFDYDGVLADTEPLRWADWRKMLIPFGIDLTWEKYSQHCRGVADVKMRDIVEDLFDTTINLPDLSQYLAARRQLVCEWSLAKSPIPASTIDMLRRFSDRRLGLVTSAMRDDIEPVLRHAKIQDCFEACVFGEDVVRRKPAPDPYLKIASKLGTIAGIAFEDSESGVISARDAGFLTVRISDPADLPETVARVIEIY